MSARVLRHPNGQSRGAAFTRMATRAHGSNVIDALHGKIFSHYPNNTIQARFADNPIQRELKRRQQAKKHGQFVNPPPVSPSVASFVPGPLVYPSPSTATSSTPSSIASASLHPPLASIGVPTMHPAPASTMGMGHAMSHAALLHPSAMVSGKTGMSDAVAPTLQTPYPGRASSVQQYHRPASHAGTASAQMASPRQINSAPPGHHASHVSRPMDDEHAMTARSLLQLDDYAAHSQTMDGYPAAGGDGYSALSHMSDGFAALPQGSDGYRVADGFRSGPRGQEMADYFGKGSVYAKRFPSQPLQQSSRVPPPSTTSLIPASVTEHHAGLDGKEDDLADLLQRQMTLDAVTRRGSDDGAKQ